MIQVPIPFEVICGGIILPILTLIALAIAAIVYFVKGGPQPRRTVTRYAEIEGVTQHTQYLPRQYKVAGSKEEATADRPFLLMSKPSVTPGFTVFLGYVGEDQSDFVGNPSDKKPFEVWFQNPNGMKQNESFHRSYRDAADIFSVTGEGSIID
jgi:hypothetical protein